jgi:hypothetical protein
LSEEFSDGGEEGAEALEWTTSGHIAAYMLPKSCGNRTC